MFLTFYVEGSSSSPYSDNGSGYLSDLSDKATAVSEMSWDQVSEAVKGRAERAAESVKSAVRYLVGKPVPPVVGAQTDTLDKLDGQEEKKSWWGLTGMFSGLRSGGGSSASGGDEHSAMYTEGEVHAELIRVSCNCNVYPITLIQLSPSRMTTVTLSSDTWLWMYPVRLIHR